MQKYVLVVYDFYEIKNGLISKKEKFERVPFGEDTVEYNSSASYADNVCNFVGECMESQAVCMGDKYIPIHDIHGFYFDIECKEEKQEPKKIEIPEKLVETIPVKKPNISQREKLGNRRRNKFRKMNRRREKIPAATTLPFNVENVPSDSKVDSIETTNDGAIDGIVPHHQDEDF